MKIEIFEPLLSPAEAPTEALQYGLQQFEAGLEWLKSRGVEVDRHEITKSNASALEEGIVKTAVELQGMDSLPITALDGTIISVGGYPSRAQILESAGYQPADDPGYREEILVLDTGMRGALCANALALFNNCYNRALALGLSEEELYNLVQAARSSAKDGLTEDTLTKLEQFLAFGPSGKPKSPRCACSE